MVPIDKTLFNACDEARNNLNTCGIEIKVKIDIRTVEKYSNTVTFTGSTWYLDLEDKKYTNQS